MSDEFAEGGYRFEDLKCARIVSNRTDLVASSARSDFRGRSRPASAPPGFRKSEVHAWLRQRAALRDNSAK